MLTMISKLYVFHNMMLICLKKTSWFLHWQNSDVQVIICESKWEEENIWLNNDRICFLCDAAELYDLGFFPRLKFFSSCLDSRPTMAHLIYYMMSASTTILTSILEKKIAGTRGQHNINLCDFIKILLSEHAMTCGYCRCPILYVKLPTLIIQCCASQELHYKSVCSTLPTLKWGYGALIFTKCLPRCSNLFSTIVATFCHQAFRMIHYIETTMISLFVFLIYVE